MIHSQAPPPPGDYKEGLSSLAAHSLGHGKMNNGVGGTSGMEPMEQNAEQAEEPDARPGAV